MRFYFAAHTKSFEKYLTTYEAIISTLQEAGWKLSDNWIKREIEAQEADGDDFFRYYKNLYQRTSKKIKSSDVLVAEISEKSTTVAQQLVYALENNIPVWCLYKKGCEKNIPAFIRTRKDKKLSITEYDSGNLEKVINKNIQKYSRREIKFNFYLTQDMNDFLEKQASQKKNTKSEVVRDMIKKSMIK